MSFEFATGYLEDEQTKYYGKSNEGIFAFLLHDRSLRQHWKRNLFWP